MVETNCLKNAKQKKISGHSRRKPRRDPYDMVLIVCEGETEEKYFKGVVNELQLNTANVLIPNNTAGSSPRKVVEFAVGEYNKAKDFDKIFCVIDKDDHSQYSESLDFIRRKRLKKGHSMHAIPSIPCFEFWILLHYKMTTQSFYIGHSSACKHVLRELKQFIPAYEKASNTLFQMTKDRMKTAINNAEKILKHCALVGTDDPSTKIHELVLYLQQLKGNM